VAQNVRHITRDQGKNQYLASLSPEQATCMSQGHSWPKIRPGRALPKGVDAVPQKMGAFQVRETCPVCDTVRIWTTLPGGGFDLDVQYRYEHPRSWVTKESGVDVTRRDIKADVWSQFGTGLRTAKSAS
jgi:hypothetical protein